MKSFCLLVLAFLFLSVPASGQLVRLTEWERECGEVGVDFGWLDYGVRAENVAKAWGITFRGSGGSEVRAAIPGSFPPINICTPPRLVALENQPEDPDGDSLLIINFEEPVRRVSLGLSNLGEGVGVTIRAYALDGTALGSLQESGSPGGAPVIILETPAEAGIAKLTIDYDRPGHNEQLASLRVAFVSKPSFTLFLPQLAEGPAGGGRLTTTVSLLNLSNTTAQTTVAFFDSDGMPLPIGPAGASEIHFEMAGRSKTFSTEGEFTDLRSGYVRIDSSTPVEATALFQVLDSEQRPVAQAGIAAVAGTVISRGTVFRKAPPPAILHPVGRAGHGIQASSTSNFRIAAKGWIKHSR